ncbi:CD1375 family protein [Paenibacillus eucommiae]|uniref:Uncharacterized protein n=1 Tax=Paenibacillus eucommiae TaxID=1355755 RepID=A0ABS4IUE6_9BACL|nr:CD1375 family protein [Paenibacillus eucommiae]MBP1990194.1 hypothetical protein [Paenibacillus eucommiae]
MAQIYFKLIVAGRKTIQEVPENLRADVQTLLDNSNA